MSKKIAPESGLRRAAIVAVLLGEEATAEVFRHLSEEEIERLAKEMAAMGAVPQGTGERILEEFHQTVVAANYIAKLLATYPWISWLGLAIIVYVAAQMSWTGIHDLGCLYVSPEVCKQGMVSTLKTLMNGI